ncbi:hypothetical protein CMI47_12890 [Candidatus Pacearchaeota archaeon]|nr:hypothetical protein [Candidatus Pacearchaeota archaeon]|tara:strand:+ start:42303 stop:42671 length:369 start_codon:yes stop_codon:yes gene_type:complete
MAKKRESKLLQTNEIELWQAYREGPYLNKKKSDIRIIIPIKRDNDGNVTCKLVKVIMDKKSETLNVQYMRYGVNYSFIEVDMKLDEDWLKVLALEKVKKAKVKKEDEQPQKKKRGRPKKKSS